MAEEEIEAGPTPAVDTPVVEQIPEPKEPKEPKASVLAREIGEALDADILLFSGELHHESADDLIRLVKKKDRRPNVMLMLTTRGGSPDAAYRVARGLQTHYKRVILYIYGMCKSAGTLVAIGSDEIVLSDYGEFGPLDIQLGKKDELFESTSGLDINQALVTLDVRAYTHFRNILIGVRQGTRGRLSTKLAAEIASSLVAGLYGRIYAQIDPLQLGATERAMRIAIDYGERLARDNVLPGAIESLATEYPSHGFVIDLGEAKQLFKNVREPSDAEERLGECISFVTRDEDGDGEVVIRRLFPLASTTEVDDG